MRQVVLRLLRMPALIAASEVLRQSPLAGIQISMVASVVQMPPANQAVTRETFSFEVDKAKLKAAEQRDGHYLLRSNLTGEDPAVLWTRYVQLTQIESCSAR